MHAKHLRVTYRQFYLVNAVKTAREVSLDLSGWSVSVGAKVLVTEISKRYMNQVSCRRHFKSRSRICFQSFANMCCMPV